MENRQLNFDVARGGVQHRLSVCVGDTKSRTVTARFFSGSEPVPLTAAYLRGLRADGEQIYAVRRRTPLPRVTFRPAAR